MRYVLMIGTLLAFSSCQKTLEVTPKESGNTPQFNFLVRMVNPIPAMGDTLLAQLYLRQLDFQAPQEAYRLVVTFPNAFDGSLVYQGKAYRSGDWIEMAFSGLSADSTLLKIIPYQSRKGTYTLNLSCSDRKEQSKTASLAVVIP